MKRLALVLLLVLFVTGTAAATQMAVTNNTQDMAMYDIIWISCPWQGYNGECSRAAGGINPGTSTLIDLNFPPGKYRIEWRALYKPEDTWKSEYNIIIDADDRLVELLPEGPVFSGLK